MITKIIESVEKVANEAIFENVVFDEFTLLENINESNIDIKLKDKVICRANILILGEKENISHSIRLKMFNGSNSRGSSFIVPMDTKTKLLNQKKMNEINGKDKVKKVENKDFIYYGSAFGVFASEEIMAQSAAASDKTSAEIEFCEERFSKLSKSDIKDLNAVALGKKEYNEIEDMIKEAKKK